MALFLFNRARFGEGDGARGSIAAAVPVLVGEDGFRSPSHLAPGEQDKVCGTRRMRRRMGRCKEKKPRKRPGPLPLASPKLARVD